MKGEYWDRLRDAMRIWAELFENREEDRDQESRKEKEIPLSVYRG
jgi:hypothetical protein